MQYNILSLHILASDCSKSEIRERHHDIYSYWTIRSAPPGFLPPAVRLPLPVPTAGLHPPVAWCQRPGPGFLQLVANQVLQPPTHGNRPKAIKRTHKQKTQNA